MEREGEKRGEREGGREVGKRNGGAGFSGGRENVGQHSQSPVTCSSQLESGLQSKPSYVTGYRSVRVTVGWRLLAGVTAWKADMSEYPRRCLLTGLNKSNEYDNLGGNSTASQY